MVVSSITLTTEYNFINPDINEVKSIHFKEHDKQYFARYRNHPHPRKLDII